MNTEISLLALAFVFQMITEDMDRVRHMGRVTPAHSAKQTCNLMESAGNKQRWGGHRWEARLLDINLVIFRKKLVISICM
jgi:hypothetical protein